MRTPNCRSCNAPIIWGTTQAGNKIPMDAEPTDAGGYALFELGNEVQIMYVKPEERDGLLYVSHYATCVDANEWRKK